MGMFKPIQSLRSADPVANMRHTLMLLKEPNLQDCQALQVALQFSTSGCPFPTLKAAYFSTMQKLLGKHGWYGKIGAFHKACALQIFLQQ